GAVRDVAAYADAIYTSARVSRLHPDVLLSAFGCRHPAHRIILASQSAYFATLLRWSRWQPAAVAEGDSDDDLSSLPCLELVLGEEVTQKGFEWILEYFYASPHCTIASDNAFDVLSAAHYLGVAAVQTACVDFLSQHLMRFLSFTCLDFRYRRPQHLDPTNFASCLSWATRADHGEASDMLAAACRRLLALRLPSSLEAWAPALAHMEPRTLLDILSSDCLAVPTEYDRYLLVKQVAKLLLAAAAAAPSVTACTHQAATAAGRSSGSGTSGSPPHDFQRHPHCAEAGAPFPDAAEGSLELQRMLNSALHIADEGVARRLHLARSCPAAIAAPTAAPAIGRPGSGVDPGTAACPSPSDGAASGGGAGAGGAATGYGIWCAAPYSGASGGAASLLFGSVSDGTPLSDCASGGGGGGGGGEPSSRLSSQCTERSCVSSSFAGVGPEAEVLVEVTDALTAAAAAAGLGPDGGGGGGSMDRGSGQAAGPAEGAASPGGAAAAACTRLLLDGAVRYEHLTIPQLMEVQRQGLVAAPVLHSALWSRTQLDFAIFCSSSGSSSSGASGGGGGGGAVAAGAASARRPFRLCWRLPCGALKKLQAPDLLQSEAQPYAGAMWQVRLSYGGTSAAARSHLGLYVCRHLLPAAAAGGARSHGSDPSQPPHHQQQQRRPPPPRHQQQHHAAAAAAAPAAAAAAAAPAPFVSFADRQSALRSRCRVVAYQSDNTALGGRLCLGECGPFTADFAAGAFFGQAKLLPTADLALLEDDSELLVFVELLALAGNTEAGAGP
ncbi:hypothetical protein TSOC_010557, partial [Tetrabaena socialis]